MGRPRRERPARPPQSALELISRAYYISGCAGKPAETPLQLLKIPAVELHDVGGTFVFNQDGIALEALDGSVENNRFEINGHIDGYSPDAPITLHIASSRAQDLMIPPSADYVWAMPRNVRDVYAHLHPTGHCAVHLNLVRSPGSIWLRASGSVDIIDGNFVYDEFPYPIRQVKGCVVIGPASGDREEAERGLRSLDGADWVTLKNLHGMGAMGGPNQDSPLHLDGRIGPVGPRCPEPGIDLVVHGEKIQREPPLMHALGPDVRKALSIFDAPGTGQYPQFDGSFETHVLRDAGPDQKVKIDTRIRLNNADAVLVGFPYPIHGVAAEVRVNGGSINVIGAHMRRGDASVDVSGHVSAIPEEVAGDPGGPTLLKLTVRDLLIDDALLNALPTDCSQWIRRTGVTARLDVDGTLRAAAAPPKAPGPAAAPSDRGLAPDLGYDFSVALHDGTVRPENGKLLFSAVHGNLHLVPDRIDLLGLTGQRGDATVDATGSVTWDHSTPRLSFKASAKKLLLEPALHDLLPEPAQKAWDELQPVGTIDAQVSFAPQDPPHSLRIDLTSATAQPLVELPPAPSALPPGFKAALIPRDLSVTLRSLPYRLDNVKGSIEIKPQGVSLLDITAQHGKAEFKLSGTGAINGPAVWELNVWGQNVPADDDFRRGMPQALADICSSVKLNGNLGFNFDRLSYRPPAAPTTAPVAVEASGVGGADSGPPATMPADSGPQVDLHGSVTFENASIDVGVPLTEITGPFTFEAAVRDGRLQSLSGSLNLPSLKMAGRVATDFKAEVTKPADRPEMHVSRMQAAIAGGNLAGDMALFFPDESPSRYGLSLVVRDADVKVLAGETDTNLAGRMTASLAMEGGWNQPLARRGRGDVVVAGKEMYRIPVVLGLLQVTNLSLPLSSPMTSATARYSLEGEKVVFEKLQMRSDTMLMTGTGSLDFATRKVRLNFVTDNPSGLKIPLVNEWLRNAQHELLRIQVRGTVQDPKVQASSMGTIFTTVDEVLNGDDNDDHRPPRRHENTQPGK